MSEQKVEGGCHCGHLRYEASGPLTHCTWCHCSICRKVSGAPAFAWFTVPASSFRYTCGEPVRYRSSAHGSRAFCGACGTQLTFQSDALHDEIDIATASLDRPELAPPRDHTWTASKVEWVVLNDGLPQHPGQRPVD